MTTTPAPTDLDTAVDVAARAIQAYQARTAFPPEQYTWDAIPQEWRDRHLAAARVMVEATQKPLLDELAKARAELDEFKALSHDYNWQWQLESGVSRIFEGKASWLYRNSTRMTQMRYDAATAAGYDFTQYAAQMDQPVDRDALIAYLREEITLAEQEIAAIEASPATTAEPAGEPLITARWPRIPGNDTHDLTQAEPAGEPKANTPDWVTALDDAIAASGARLVFDPRNWTAPHTLHGPKATDPDREHPAHVGQTCDEYDAEPAAG